MPANVAKAIADKLQTDAGMKSFVEALAGPNNWIYDEAEDVWVIPNPKHHGSGRGFIVIQRGGQWFTAVLPTPVETH